MAVVRGAAQFIYLETTVSESLFTIHLLVAGRSTAAPLASPRSRRRHRRLLQPWLRVLWHICSTLAGAVTVQGRVGWFLQERRATRDINSSYQAIQASRGHCLSWQGCPSFHVSTDYVQVILKLQQELHPVAGAVLMAGQRC